jgi:hypothetical protein
MFRLNQIFCHIFVCMGYMGGKYHFEENQMKHQKTSFQREVFDRQMKHEILVLFRDDTLFHNIISVLITLITQM